MQNTIHNLKKALINQDLIWLNKSGFWFSFGHYSKYLKKIGIDKWLIKRTIRSFIKSLDHLEREPLRFPVESKELYMAYSDVAKALLNEYRDPELELRYIALNYRLESLNGGWDISLPDSDNSFLQEIEGWKKDQNLLWHKELTSREKKELRTARHYPEFITLIKKSSLIKGMFLNWVIRDHLPASLFIEYPSTAAYILDHHLNGRIGTVGGEKLKIQKTLLGRSRYKVVTLPFEGKEVNILNLDTVVDFRGGLSLSVRDVFKLFKEKPKRFVDVEYLAQGITNWNAQHLGYWMPGKKMYQTIDLDQDKWWRQLPPLEILTIEETLNQYGSYMDGKTWCVVVKAAREYLNMSHERCHAYLEIVIPNRDKTYNIYDFGKFARYFPYGVVDDLKMFTITTPATVAYPDENIYHTARQQVGYAFQLHHYQGLELMEEIRLDILQAREGNMIFQLQSENCANWIQTRLEELLGKEKVPNLFKINILRSESKGFVGYLFRFINYFPAKYQARLLTWFHFPFGAWRGQYVTTRQGERIFKSLNRTSFWDDIVVYHPALLHKQCESGWISLGDHIDPSEAA